MQVADLPVGARFYLAELGLLKHCKPPFLPLYVYTVKRIQTGGNMEGVQMFSVRIKT